MQQEIHRVFRIGVLVYLMSMVFVAYLSINNYNREHSSACSVVQLAANDGTNQRNDIPLKPASQSASEVEEDDDDSAKEFFNYVGKDLNRSDFQIKTISLNYAPVQGEISTPPPRG